MSGGQKIRAVRRKLRRILKTGVAATPAQIPKSNVAQRKWELPPAQGHGRMYQNSVARPPLIITNDIALYLLQFMWRLFSFIALFLINYST